MPNAKSSAEPPASRPLLHIVLFLISLACFGASLTQVAFTLQAAAPTTSAPAAATVPSAATAPASNTAVATAPQTTPATTMQTAGTQPASQIQTMETKDEAVSGYTCLIYGWITLKDYKLGWLANVAFAAVVVCFLPKKARKIADGASLLCMMFAILFLLTEELTIKGEARKIISYGPGFYLWFGSMIVMWLGFIFDPAWKLAADLEPEHVQRKTAAKAKKQPETAIEKAVPAPDDWPFFYGKKPHD